MIIPKGENNYLPFQEINKYKKKYIKIDIKGVFGRFEMCKDIVSV